MTLSRWKPLLLVALAYILPAYSIVKKMAERRDDLQLVALRIDGSFSFYGDAAKEAGAALGVAADRPEVQLDGTVYLRLPDRCRVEASSQESNKVVGAVSSNGRERFDGSPIASLAIASRELCAILGQRSSGENEARAAIERHLTQLHVDLKKTSLGRFGGQVAYVLGDERDGQPQFWVYKDSFLPARVRFTDDKGQAWDLRMLDYSSPATGEWFPRSVELYRGEEQVFKFTALKSDAKPRLDEKLF